MTYTRGNRHRRLPLVLLVAARLRRARRRRLGQAERAGFRRCDLERLALAELGHSNRGCRSCLERHPPGRLPLCGRDAHRRAQVQVHAPALLVPAPLLDLSPGTSGLGAPIQRVNLTECVEADRRQRTLRQSDCPRLPSRLGEISLSLWFLRLPSKRPPRTTPILWTAALPSSRGRCPFPSSIRAGLLAPITMERTCLRLEHGGILPRARRLERHHLAASEPELRSDVYGWPNLDFGRFRA